jgi:ferredoxin
MAKVRVVVDTGLCIAASSCVAAAPKLFRLNEDNIAMAVDPTDGSTGYTREYEADADTLAALKEAAESCPTSAITVYES